MDIYNLSGILDIPQSGARLYSLAGNAKTVASVLLAPGNGLNKQSRRLAEAHEFVGCTVCADLGRPISPEDFHKTTLCWAIYRADFIALWPAYFPQRADELRRDFFQAVEAGARFVTIIETDERCASAWAAFVQHWKQKATLVRFYGPEITGRVQ
jgi:hypothetical protein